MGGHLHKGKRVKVIAGTYFGGQKAAETNKQKYGLDFYAIIGHKGGENGVTGGFFVNRELASTAGRKGGMKSRRYGHDAKYKKQKQRRSKELEEAWKHLQSVHNKAMKEKHGG